MDLKNTVLGLELGSTRIKAVLLDENHLPIASGSFDWENRLENGVWTYDLSLVHTGVQTCFANLMKDVEEKFGQKLTTVGAMGISGMMHGYLPFDKDGNQLAPFRTWRNTITGRASKELTELFNFTVPMRWSISHLYHSILEKEDHLPRIDYLTTLCGYIHRKLTGCRVLGVCEASGMFPIDKATLDYDAVMMEKFEKLIEGRFPWKTKDILPKPLRAGEPAGTLSEAGAKFLDPTGTFLPGVPFFPPEGDVGTGMVATNSVRVGIGSVSLGTSTVGNVVVDKFPPMRKGIDMFFSPSGQPSAMVTCHNCTSDINAWVDLFAQFAEAMGMEADKNKIFPLLFKKALEGDADCGGLMSYNYISGESITDMTVGRPLFMRKPDAKLSLANFMRTHLLSPLASLKIGLDLLTADGNVTINRVYGHGGYLKTPGVGQRFLSAAVGAPVSVMETAGEGGPYGMALLAAYGLWKKPGQSLEDYLDDVFASATSNTIMAEEADIAGFNAFYAAHCRALSTERTATETF